MPPKKRARTSGGNAKTSMPAPETMDDVCEARVQLKNWVAEAYLGRHGFSTERKIPVNYGGSFSRLSRSAGNMMLSWMIAPLFSRRLASWTAQLKQMRFSRRLAR